MGPFMVALLCSIGASTWVYTKLQQRTGYGNTSSALKGTLAVGILVFIVTYTVGLMIL